MKMFYSSVLLAAMAVSAFGASSGKAEPEFTQFEFADQAGAASWYNGFTTSFFTNRINMETTIFPREYLAIADSWLGGASWQQGSIQDYTRKVLLAQELDNEGYVLTQQHSATSHDHGWPFPHWNQISGKDGEAGITAGWHFYDERKNWELCYDQARGRYPEHFGVAATKAWSLEGASDGGLKVDNNSWVLKVQDKSVRMTSPASVTVDSFNCPFFQIRWNADAKAERVQGRLQWLRAGETEWSEQRSMNFYPELIQPYSAGTKMQHSMIPLHQHPEWTGHIVRMRIIFDNVEGQELYVRSIFSHWDTRHLVNNGIYIKAAFEYFRWTGDTDFLRKMLPRLRTAMRYMMDEGHGTELNRIRCTWHGHDGRPGYTVHEDGSKTFHNGQGKGGNYWDLLPLGWDDMYTTTHYYASLLAMASLEEASAQNPGWAMPDGFMTLDPKALRKHAADVKKEANRFFFDKKKGRFVGCVDADGISHDYGFTFINLEAVHYGIASDKNAAKVMAWIDGQRIVESDTSKGEELYSYRLAPRATTKRNLEWYSFAWWGPEMLPYGGQVQDGGAVLGFSFYDIMSRIKTLGADNAWERLMGIRAWDEEVAAYGGYRKYYGDGKGGTTLQGGGTAGGVGIDFEFTESSMLSAVVPLGFMGLRPDGQVFNIEPNLPQACPEMTVRNLKVCGVLMDVTVSDQQVTMVLKERPATPLRVKFGKETTVVEQAGTFRFER